KAGPTILLALGAPTGTTPCMYWLRRPRLNKQVLMVAVLTPFSFSMTAGDTSAMGCSIKLLDNFIRFQKICKHISFRRSDYSVWLQVAIHHVAEEIRVGRRPHLMITILAALQIPVLHHGFGNR